MQILVFGASIVYGKWDSRGGWVQRLRTYIEEKEGRDGNIDVYNLGIDGGTSEKVLERLERETQPRVCDKNAIIIISIGGNDSEINKKSRENRVSIEKYKENMEKIANEANRFSSKVIFIGMTPVDESKMDPIPWRKELSYINEEIKKYNSIMKDVAIRNNIECIDFDAELDKVNWGNLLADGVHPNDKGHELLFNLLKEKLETKNIL